MQMKTATIVVTAVGAALAAAGITYAATHHATAAAPGGAAPGTTPSGGGGGSGGGTTPSPSSVAWIATTTVNPGDRVRVSIAAADVDTIAQSMGIPVATVGSAQMQMFQQLLASSAIVRVLAPQGAQMSAWAPGDPLPLDWPKDDAGAASEFHVEFTYAGAAPIYTTAIPIPIHAWVAKGMGA
jgi:hypothetical protein